MLHLDFLSLDRVAGEEVVGSWNKEGGFLVFFFRIFCLVFVISSIPERDKQHFQGEKKKSCYQKAKKGESFTFPCIPFPHLSSSPHLSSLPHGFSFHLSFWFIFSHSAFPLCPSCPICNWPHLSSTVWKIGLFFFLNIYKPFLDLSS